MEKAKKRTKVTYNGTQVKNREPQEHEFCIMERIQEAAFHVSDAHFLIMDLLEEPVFRKSTCYLPEEIDEIDLLDEMQNDLLSMYLALQKTVSRFTKFHEFYEENDPCKCYEEDDEDSIIYYQCPECRYLDEEGLF